MDKKSIAEFYNTNFFYEGNRDLHHMTWGANTRSFAAARRNTIKMIAEALAIKKTDIVLDAGCGTGGSAIYISEKFGCTVVGVTLIKEQKNQANQFKRKSTAKKRLKFLAGDYSDTGLQDGAFDAIYAIESVCYEENKINFLKEAYRLLKKGGRLAVLDAYVNREPRTTKDRKINADTLEGYSLYTLATKNSFKEGLEGVGFRNVKFYSKNKSVLLTNNLHYFFGNLIYPFLLIFLYLRLLSKASVGMVKSVKNERYLIVNKLWEYGIYYAEK